MPLEPRTSGTLLQRTKQADNSDAWTELFHRYQPMLERWTRARIGNRADADEISQRIWCELIDRLPRFQYDPKRSFRSWLRRLHRHRLLDYLKQHRRYVGHLENYAQDVSDPILGSSNHPLTSTATHPTPDNTNRATIDELLDIQSRVRSRISQQTWDIFWLVTMENQSVGDVARKYSMRYASAFAAVARVHKMLQEESQR
jgi:RNA polymerase sigma-70 factor (ECF subfamily)